MFVKTVRVGSLCPPPVWRGGRPLEGGDQPSEAFLIPCLLLVPLCLGLSLLGLYDFWEFCAFGFLFEISFLGRLRLLYVVTTLGIDIRYMFQASVTILASLYFFS